MTAALRRLRDQAGSHAALAVRLHITPAAVSRLLAVPPKAQPSRDTARTVARLVGVKVDALLSGQSGEKEASDGGA